MSRARRRHRRRHRRCRLRTGTAARWPPRHDRRTGRARRRAGRQLRQRHAAESEFGHSDVGARASGRRCRAICAIRSVRWRSAGAICRDCCRGCGGSLRPVRHRRKSRPSLAPCGRCWPRRRNGIVRLAEEAGVGDLITRQGVLFAYPDRAAFEAEALSWRMRRDNGTRWLELDDDELRQSEPTLSRHYKFAVLVQENGQCRDPGAYVAALVRHADRLGRDAAADAGDRLPHRTAAAARGAHRTRTRSTPTTRSSRPVRIRNSSPRRPAIACRWRPNAAITS